MNAANSIRAFLITVMFAVAGCQTVTSGSTQESAVRALTEAERVAIQLACEAVSYRYAHYIDTKDFENLPTAFSADGVWEVLGNRMQGAEQIRKYWRTRTALWKPNEGRLHQIANQRIEVIDRDHARGSAHFVVYFFDTRPGANQSVGPQLITRSTDEYIRTPEGWRLQRRSLERLADLAPP
jgi:3-phenylpropionate/cinnamic acid dioxygenase small subunit